MKKDIKLFGKNLEKSLALSNERKIFTNKDLDYTCIEILKEDNIKKYFNMKNKMFLCYNFLMEKIYLFQMERYYLLQTIY